MTLFDIKLPPLFPAEGSKIYSRGGSLYALTPDRKVFFDKAPEGALAPEWVESYVDPFDLETTGTPFSILSFKAMYGAFP